MQGKEGDAIMDGTMNTTDMTEARVRITEFQDYQGNVHYFHADARSTWMPDGSSVYDFLTAETTGEQIDSIFNEEEDNTTEGVED